MKISIRSIQKDIYQIDAEPTDFIGAIKSKIEQSQGFTPSSQKIIFSGRVLADDKTLESYGFRGETDYLVQIVAKPKSTPTLMTPAAPAAAHCFTTATPTNGNASMPSSASVDAAVTSTQTASAPLLSLQTSVSPSKTLSKRALSPDTGFSSAPNVTLKKPKLFSGSSPPASSSEAHSPSSAPSTAAASMPTAEATLAAATLASSDSSSALAPVSPTPGAPIHAFGDTSFFPIGEALQSTISNMVNMGFGPDQVQRALRASYNNPDRAVEYLTTEIPAHLDAEAAAAVQVSPASAPATSASDQAQNIFREQQQQTGAGTDLGTPRTSLSRDPQFEQVQQNLIQNPEPFLRFLAVPNPQMAQAFAANPEVLVQLLAAVGDSEGEESPLPSAQVINVQGEDRVAIERLEALGFSQPAAIEAYLVCDKDEELAANYLLENGF